MLTIQSNLKIHDLETLSKVIIKADIINFGLNKVGGGFTAMIADKIINKLTLNKNKTIVVINDITLQMTEKLLEAGYTNIYLAFGKWNKDGTVSSDTTVYNIMKAFVKHNIKEDLNVISLKEIFNMKIDGFIVNPPYGSIGANITKNIIDRVDFEEYVNLLPANDYKRNKTKDLFNYQSEMEELPRGSFKDAAVTTHLALVHKNKVNDLTEDDYEINTYIDPTLMKYFRVTRNRQHYAIDKACWPKWKHEYINIINHNNTFTIWQKDISNRHMPYTKDSKSYKWNVLKTIDTEWFENNCINTQGISNGALLTFNSAIEKDNFTAWFYSRDGFRFISKVFTAINIDSGVYSLYRILPKVDWTRSWTVEEILRDYSYTEEEITEVMNDLVNFRGMDD